MSTMVELSYVWSVRCNTATNPQECRKCTSEYTRPVPKTDGKWVYETFYTSNAILLRTKCCLHFISVYPHKMLRFFTNFKLKFTLEDPDRYVRWKTPILSYLFPLEQRGVRLLQLDDSHAPGASLAQELAPPARICFNHECRVVVAFLHTVDVCFIHDCRVLDSRPVVPCYGHTRQ